MALEARVHVRLKRVASENYLRWAYADQGNRRVYGAGCTDKPTTAWVTLQPYGIKARKRCTCVHAYSRCPLLSVGYLHSRLCTSKAEYPALFITCQAPLMSFTSIVAILFFFDLFKSRFHQIRLL